MGRYKDRLQSEFDEITRDMTALTDAAANDNRDLTDDETKQLERSQERRDALAPQIQRLVEHDEATARNANVNRSAPVISHTPMVQRDTSGDDPLAGLTTPGHWAALIHRSWVRRDPEATARLEEIYRANQVVADNPGIIPQPIVAPVVDAMRNIRPLVQSLTVRQAPSGKFDRPVVNQQVLVGQQATEKTATASQPMKIDPVTVELMTQAGHLNISKQDIRWSQPSILSLVYDSFAKVYARVSDKAACADFVSAVTQTSEIPGTAGAATAGNVDEALGTAAGLIGGADGDEAELNHLWLSRDVAVTLASMRSVNGDKLYNIPLVNGTSGDLDGIPVTVDPRFAAGTAIAGDASLVEYWEDLEGFLTVDEPDVLGQLVGYAGYSRLAVLVPDAFVQFTNATTLSARVPPLPPVPRAESVVALVN